MNYLVCISGRYKTTSVLERIHAAFFTSHQIRDMIYIPDEIVLARMMTALDLEFEKAIHYHDEGYERDNNYGLPLQVMRPVHVYSVSTTEASYNLTEYMVTQCPISPFTPK